MPVDSGETVSRAWRSLLLGGVIGNLVAAGAVIAAAALMDHPGLGQSIAALNIGLVPALVGLVASWFWRRLPLTLGALLLHSLWLTAVGLGGAAFAFSEGIICLLMAAPLHFVGVLLSLWVGHKLFRDQSGKVRVSALPLALFLALMEARFAPPPGPAVFSDELHIAAPPSAVWPHVVSFAPIPSPPDFWVFRLGLPYPVETPPGGDAVGRERLCIFSRGVVFRERVAVFEPGRRLVFDIVAQPRDPELLGHLETHQGEFELRDEGDGTTTLIGRSTYTLHTRPVWYFAWWTHYLGRAVHLRVMENVRRLAESR